MLRIETVDGRRIEWENRANWRPIELGMLKMAEVKSFAAEGEDVVVALEAIHNAAMCKSILNALIDSLFAPVRAPYELPPSSVVH
jgi:hypothetical protein